MKAALLAAEGAPGPDGWVRLPEPSRDELDPGRRDARFAKLDRAARLLAQGALRALGGAALDGERTGLVLASLVGSLAADERFDATRGRPEGASPALFPATLATAPAAELSIRLGLKGPVFSVRAGLRAAVALASRLVARGEAETVLACGLEVAAAGAARLLGTSGPFRESVSVIVVDRSLDVAITDALSLPRGALLANEEAARLIETLNSPG